VSALKRPVWAPGATVIVREPLATTVRVDASTNKNTDWTKLKQSHTSLVHHKGLLNGHNLK
jgi:hypothetical protein